VRVAPSSAIPLSGAIRTTPMTESMAPPPGEDTISLSCNGQDLFRKLSVSEASIASAIVEQGSESLVDVLRHCGQVLEA
jgi:hypothetical protein